MDMLKRTLISQLSPGSPVVEAYRVLRTNLQFATMNYSFRTILVTSPGPAEGKSTIIANLASVCAADGKRCIIVDSDLRMPVQHEILKCHNKVGLTDVLLGRVEPEKALQETPVPGLRLLPSGPVPPNQAELLGSSRMTDLTEFLRSAADLIFFDTPPVLPVTDASVLAAKVDGVLLVANAGNVSREALILAKKALEKVNARLLGVVLNKAELQGGYAYYHSYYQRGRR
ncbi:MAG: CpsD/CapB family tyrosine-protein kinase [Syntrophothermus sp.]